MVTFNRLQVVDILKRNQAITGSGSTNPILACVLIAPIDQNTIRFSSTNFDLCYEKEIVNSGHGLAKAFCISCKLLLDLLQSNNEENFTLDFVDESTKITIGSFTSTIPILPAENFPAFKVEDDLNMKLKVPTGLLLSGIGGVAFSACKMLSKPHLRSVLFTLDTNKISFTGADGQRLAQIDEKVENPHQARFIVDYDHLDVISKVFTDSGDSIDVELCERFCILSNRSNQIVLRFRLMNVAEYPDVKGLLQSKIYSNFDKYHFFRIKKESFKSLLKRISLFFADIASQMNYTFSDKILQTFISNPTVGTSEDRIVIQSIKPLAKSIDHIIFNPNHMLMILDKIEEEDVFVGLLDPRLPIVVMGATQQELTTHPRFLALVMPFII